MEASADQALFVAIGLAPTTAANVSSNAKVSAALRELVAEAGVSGGCDKAVGNLLYNLATRVCPLHLSSPPHASHAAGWQFPGNALAHRKLVAQYVSSGQIKARSSRQGSSAAADSAEQSMPQLDGALVHLTALGESPLDVAALEVRKAHSPAPHRFSHPLRRRREWAA